MVPLRVGTDKGVRLVLTIALGALLYVVAGTPVMSAATRRPPFPSYNIASFCYIDFGEGTHDAVLRELCNRDERTARNNLRRRWSAIPAQQLRDCVAAVAEAQKKYGGTGSYQGIRNCVSELQNAAEVARAAAASSAPARKPKAPAVPANPEALSKPPILQTTPAPSPEVRVSPEALPVPPNLGAPRVPMSP